MTDTSLPRARADVRQLNPKGVLIAIGLPILLVGALVATLLGTGVLSRSADAENGSLWLWTTPTGEIARVNGLTAATDVRFEVADAAGNPVQIEQNDRYLLLRDITTGRVSAVDLTSLAITGTAETTPGEGVRVALFEDRAFIVDRLQGKVRQVDPADLSAVGEPLSFPVGLVGGAFDRDGDLWIGVPREGTLVAVRPGDDGASTARTEAVADPGQDLSVTVLGDGVAVLNTTAQRVTTLRTDGGVTEASIQIAGPTRSAETSPGTVAAVTVTDPPSVIAVEDEVVRSFSIAASTSPLLGAAVEFHSRVYVPDGDAGSVLVYTVDGEALDPVAIDSGGGPIELYSTGDILFANAVYTNVAVVIAADGTSRRAEKDRDDILGGNVPPVEQEPDFSSVGNEDGPPVETPNDGGTGGDRELPPPAEDEPEDEPEPDPEVPGAVGNLAGTVADRSASLSWDPASDNGAPITKYVVEGADREWELAPGQRVLDVEELVNGELYSFTVTAHNAVGAGPPAFTETLRPTADVPDPVASVRAVANPDGTVDVSWDPPNAQGLEITGYRIEVVGNGQRSVAEETSETSHRFADRRFPYGTEHMFSVTALAGDAAAEPSPPSASVVPFNKPAAPRGVRATTVQNQAGTIEVTWSQPANNGRKITEYVVTGGGKTARVTGTKATLTGLGHGATVRVTVKAVNEAGEGPGASANGTTIAKPKINAFRVQGYNCDYCDTWVKERDVDYGGAGAENSDCEITWDGKPISRGKCNKMEAVNNPVKPGSNAAVVLTVKNKAGEAKSTTRFEWLDP